MKIITGTVLTAALLAATPAMADRGFNGHRGFDSHRGHAQHRKHARHVHHHYIPQHRVVRHHVFHQQFGYSPAPLVYYTRPAPVGVSIVLPSIHIPIR